MHSRPLAIVLLLFTVSALIAGLYSLQQSPRNPAARHFEAGLRLEAAGDPAGALREWQLARALDPSLPGVHLALGRGLLAQGAAFHAARELETAARRTPTAPHLWCLLAEAYRRLDQQGRAYEAARFSAGQEPRCGRARRALGAVFYQRQEYAPAAGELALAASLDPRDTESRALLARTHLALGDAGKALEAARDAHRASSGSPAAGALLAHALLAREDPSALPEALNLLDAAVKAFPEDPDLRADRGQAYLRLERLPQARAELERAIRLAPRHRLAVAQLALVYEALGKEQEAAEQRGLSRELTAADRRRDELEGLLKQRPDDGALLYELADLLARDQKFARALALMQRAAELRPGDPQVHRQLRDIQDAARRAALPRSGASS